MPNELEPMPVIFRLAYETAAREHEQQQQVLENLRARAGLTLSAGSVAVGLLASAAITPGPDPRGWIAAGILLYLAGCAICVWILLPRGSFSRRRRDADPEKGSAFESDHNIKSWLTEPAWVEHGDAYAYEHVALSLYGQRSRNADRLDRQFNVMTVGAITLGASIVSWLMALRGR